MISTDSEEYYPYYFEERNMPMKPDLEKKKRKLTGCRNTIKLISVVSVSLLLAACQRADNPDTTVSIESNTGVTENNTVSSEGNQEYNRYEYSSSYITYPDEYFIHCVVKSMDIAEAGNRKYGFQSDIPDEERQACIEATENILERIGFDGELNIYIYTEREVNGSFYIDEKSSGGNDFFAYSCDWKDADYVTGLLLAVYGKYCNYGAAYGYADYLCDSAGDAEKNNVKPQFNTEYNCYDLNMLCFDDDFLTADEAEEARAVSVSFVRDYIAENGEAAFGELLEKSGSVQTCGKFNNELEKWYKANGLTPGSPLSELLYTYGGYSYQYIAYNGYAVFHMTRDWKDADYGSNPLVTENFLHENYSETRKFYEINTEQMKQYKKLFNLKNDVMDVSVIIENGKESYADLYVGAGQDAYIRLHIINASSMMHEYINALCLPTSISDNWAVEGLAGAFDTRYNHYAYDYTAMDFKDIYNRAVYTGQHYDPDYSYEAGVSFIYYLCDTYGERRVIEYVCDNHDLTTVTDKSFDELVLDWKNYLEASYS